MLRKKASKTSPMATTLKKYCICCWKSGLSMRQIWQGMKGKFKHKCEHMESLVQAMNDLTATARLPHCILDVKLVPLSAKDDIEVYLINFERIMSAYEIHKNQWPYHLASQLTGKAQLVFAAISLTETRDYDAIKAAILARYDINEEAYRR